MAKKIRVGIVFGGRSAEHEVSLQSAKNIIDAIDTNKYELVLIGIDKDVMKRLLRDAGIPVARFVAANKYSSKPIDFDAARDQLGLPLFVKPANLGSSVGIHKVTDRDEFERAVRDALNYDDKVLIEECINGREIECSVLGNDNPIASVPGAILPRHEFYSYEAKYLDENGAVLEIPAKLSSETLERIQIGRAH